MRLCSVRFQVTLKSKETAKLIQLPKSAKEIPIDNRFKISFPDLKIETLFSKTNGNYAGAIAHTIGFSQ